MPSALIPNGGGRRLFARCALRVGHDSAQSAPPLISHSCGIIASQQASLSQNYIDKAETSNAHSLEDQQ